MKIITIVGARPQFIKAAAVSRLIRKHHEELLIHTGQHYDKNMSEVFFEEMNIPDPNYNLRINGVSHGEMTGKMIIGLEKILVEEKPDIVLLYGDTNSTLSGAIAASKLHIPVVHVEAGNRIGMKDNPEEINRILTDHVASLLLCATEEAKNNLFNENIKQRVYVVGNIMYDSFKYFSELMKEKEITVVDYEEKLVNIPEKFYYLTCHREENTFSDEPLTEILCALNSMPQKTIYPVHPRNRIRAAKLVSQNNLKNIILVPPVKYSDSVWLTNHAERIVTDSGGLQCEAFFAQKPCVTIFDCIIWPETMVGNRNQLARPDRKQILDKMNSKQTIDPEYKPFGDGHTAERIIQLIEKSFG